MISDSQARAASWPRPATREGVSETYGTMTATEGGPLMKYGRPLSPLTLYRADPVAVARHQAAPYLDTAGGAPLPWPMRAGELLTVIGAGLAALVAACTLLAGVGWPVRMLLMMAATAAAACLVYPGSVSVQTRRLRLAQARATYRHDAPDSDLGA